MSRLAAVLVLGQVMSGVAWQTSGEQPPVRPEDAAARPPGLQARAVTLGGKEHRPRSWMAARARRRSTGSDDLASCPRRGLATSRSAWLLGRADRIPGSARSPSRRQPWRAEPYHHPVPANDRLCQRRRGPALLDRVAFTAADNRVVFICPRMLLRTSRENWEHLVAVLIHEVLHTLGLGEDPPSSTEITRTVRRLCREPLSW